MRCWKLITEGDSTSKVIKGKTKWDVKWWPYRRKLLEEIYNSRKKIDKLLFTFT